MKWYRDPWIWLLLITCTPLAFGLWLIAMLSLWEVFFGSR